MSTRVICILTVAPRSTSVSSGSGRLDVTGPVWAKLFWLSVKSVSVDDSHILEKGVLIAQSPERERREKQNKKEKKNQTQDMQHRIKPN